jgi:predicted NBD/HSP70 family sugar kinase
LRQDRLHRKLVLRAGADGAVRAPHGSQIVRARRSRRSGRGIGDAEAQRHDGAFFDRFARAIAGLVNILDPDAIVFGGGLSNIDALYSELPPRVERYAFTPEGPTRIVKNMHGDSSGVRGAAWLWREDEIARGLTG